MDRSHHMAPASSNVTTVTELDLSACQSGGIVDRINAVPGLKTSAAFFTFLRANLVLPHSAMSSNVSTPYLEPQTTSPPLLSTTMSQKKTSTTPPLDDDIPDLSLDILTTHDDKVDALKLVADSIAQQRQTASSALVFHPLLLAILLVAQAIVYQYAWVAKGRDLGTTLVLGSGAIMTYLLAIRYAVSPYIARAEGLKYDFLVNEEGEEDIVIGTRWGKEIIGACVLRLESSGAATGGKKKRGGGSLKGGKGVIRAWTTRLRYRGRGVGGDMLAEAVRITRERCGKDAEVGFAREHANSGMVLWEFFNGVFRRGERRAARGLERIAGGVGGKGKR